MGRSLTTCSISCSRSTASSVWVLDNRSASGKGAESQWPVYGRLGELELQDLEDGVTWLKQQSCVDPSRLVLSGWSYGGFMTAYALTHSTSWSAGIVGAPVTDWRDYDSIYTERLMKLPKNNADGYRRTAPRFAADRLHGRMLLLHGTMDDNVHMQNSVQFAYELQKAGKPFEMMVYPKSATRLQRSSLDHASPSDDVRLRHARDGAGHSGGTRRRASSMLVERARRRGRRRCRGASPSAAPSSIRRRAWTRGSTPTTRSAVWAAARSGVSHRQRRRHTGRKQPPAPDRQPRPRVASRPGDAVPHEQALARFLSSYAEQAWQHGFHVARRARRRHVRRPAAMRGARVGSAASIREREPRLSLGGWANPHASASKQVDFLLDSRFCAEFYLTQVVSHLNLEPVKRFLDEVERRHVPLPGMFSVFYYRSASPKTLATLNRFMPVPIEGLVEEFGSRLSAVDVCARTMKALRALGVRHFCICNLPMQDSWSTLSAIKHS